ncbi:MAG: hypothetical protein KAJ23_14355, partial [Maribacter sp.]|nr:hypothetical protein [Maribacter sp.]
MKKQIPIKLIKGIMKNGQLGKIMAMLCIVVAISSCGEKNTGLQLENESHIVLIGNNLGSRMLN